MTDHAIDILLSEPRKVSLKRDILKREILLKISEKNHVLKTTTRQIMTSSNMCAI